MAVINSKKLLPPSKSKGTDSQKFLVPISNIIPKSSAIVKAGDIVPAEDQPKQTRTSLLFEVIRIRKKVIKLEKLINKNTKLYKKSEERKRKLLERQKFEKREKELEKKTPKNEKTISGPSLPKIGFLDRLKRFLLFTALGYAFNKFGKHIPKVLEFAKKLTPAFKFVEELTGNILNGVVNFIGAGYKAYDQVRGIAKSIGGENFEKTFDEFSKQFNIFANLAIIAGLAATGGTDFELGKGGKSVTKKPGFDRVRGGRVNQATQSRYLQRYGKGALKQRFGSKALQGITQKGTGRIIGKAFGRVPIIGGLIDFIVSTVIFKEKPGRAAAKAVGATIGSALGTFIPVPFAGTILGGILGDIVGGALYDSLVDNKGIQRKAQGGQVTRGGKKVGGAIRRKIKKIRRRPPRIQPQRTIPGKDIGGKKEIEKLFPTSKDKTKKDPLGTLEKTSKNLKEIPMLGGLMGASIDLVMGQKPEKSVFQRIGYGFGALIQNAIDSQSSQTIESIQKQIVGLAGGGIVPRTLSSNENIGMKIGEQISRTFEVMINSKVNESLQSIRRQLNLDGITEPGTRPGSAPDGSPGGGLAGGAVAPSELYKEIGADLEQWNIYRNSVALIESNGDYSEPGGSGMHYDGRYQMGAAAKKDGSRVAGVDYPGHSDDPNASVRVNFRNNPELQETLFTGFTIANHRYLMRNPKYKTASVERKLEVLGYAHNQGMGGAENWLKTGQVGADGFGTKGTAYTNLIKKNFLAKRKGQELEVAGGAIDIPSSGVDSGSFDIVQYVTGDATYRGDGKQFYYDKEGHGLPSNYHDHIAFRTLEEKERAKKKLRAAGIEIGSEYRPGDPGYHGKNLAIDVPGSQWVGSGKIGNVEYKGSARVREVLGLTPYEKGGKVYGLTRAILGEKGPEFVLDADTTAALEQNFPGFLSALNRAKYDDAISVLKNYTSYEGENTSTIMLQRVIVEKPVPMPMGGGNASTSSIDSSMDSILQPLTVG